MSIFSNAARKVAPVCAFLLAALSVVTLGPARAHPLHPARGTKIVYAVTQDGRYRVKLEDRVLSVESRLWSLPYIDDSGVPHSKGADAYTYQLRAKSGKFFVGNMGEARFFVLANKKRYTYKGWHLYPDGLTLRATKRRTHLLVTPQGVSGG